MNRGARLPMGKGRQPHPPHFQTPRARHRQSIGSATLVLGVIPLLQDVFWIGLAVTIMAGLSFGTILTMVLVPVLYVTLHRIRAPEAGPAA